MREINGLPLIAHIWRRLLACKELDGVYLSTASVDNEHLVNWLAEHYGYFRGWSSPFHQDNLIKRHYEACSKFDADAFVRVTCDELFVDPRLIDYAVRYYRDHYPKYRGVTNWHLGRTWSEGVDLDIWSMELMAELNRDPECPQEDFATYAVKKYGDQIGHFASQYQHGDIHLSIDTQDDLKRAERMLKWMGTNDLWDYSDTIKAWEATR